MDILENLYEDEKIKLLEKFSKVEHDDIYLTEEDLSIPNIEELDKEEYFIFMLNQMDKKIKLYEKYICTDSINLKSIIQMALDNEDYDDALNTIWLVNGSWNHHTMYLK
jgi:hypothetical protein